MKIILKSKDRFIKPLIENKQTSTFSVLEGVQFISELESFSSRENRESLLLIQIIEDRKILLRDQIKLGYGEGTHYLAYLNHRVKHLHEIKGEPIPKDIQEVLSELERSYKEELNPSLNQSNRSYSLESDEKVDETEIDSSEKNGIETNRKLLYWVIPILLSAIGLVIFFLMGVSSTKSNEEATTEALIETTSETTETVEETTKAISLEELLMDKRFEDALLLYPQEFPVIERSIFYLGQDGIPYLEKFLQEKDYPKGHFDLNYLKKNFQAVVDLKDQADTDERKAQLIVSYLHLGQYAEADALNQVLQDSTLQQQIQKQKEEVMIDLIKQDKIEEARYIQESTHSEIIQQYLNHYDVQKAELENTINQLKQEDLSEESRKELENYRQELETYLNQLKENLKKE